MPLEQGGEGTVPLSHTDGWLPGGIWWHNSVFKKGKEWVLRGGNNRCLLKAQSRLLLGARVTGTEPPRP